MALRSITLRDFVLAEALELPLQEGFSVLSGETGAGKSIIIDALQLAMGARADASVVREGCAKADITASFDLSDTTRAMLDELGIDVSMDDELLLRRTIDAQGKSRGWINGTPATATQLRTLGATLVDIHGQHAWQNLLQADSMRTLLDAYGHIDTHPVAQCWQAYTTAQKQLQQARQRHEQLLADQERLQWQIGELEKLQPQANEWQALNEDHQRLAHAKDLLDAAQLSLQLLENDETGVLHGLHAAQQALDKQRAIASEFGVWADALDSAHIQIEEVIRSLHASQTRAELDPQHLAHLEQRLADWLALARRFKCQPEQLPELWQQWQSQLQALEQEADLSALQQQQEQAHQTYLQAAQAVSQQRTAAAARLSEAITAGIQQLGMQGGRFLADVQTNTQAGPHGVDTVDFLVAGHAGSSLHPVAKVASGGELSRLALAIAVTTSQLGSSETLIFDEVDAGIGGAVAQTVGALIRQLGTHRQVLAVTHLAQVAACANHHFLIQKTAPTAPQTLASSQVLLLDEKQRTQEIARMLSGNSTSASLAHAAELLAAARTPPQPTGKKRRS